MVPAPAPAFPSFPVESAPAQTSFRSSQTKRPAKPKFSLILIGSGISALTLSLVLLYVLMSPAPRTPNGKVARNDGGSKKRANPESIPQTDESLEEALAKLRGTDPESKTPVDMPEPTNPAVNGAEETTENIPPEIKAKLEFAYDETALPMLIGYLSHAHAGVRERAANYLGSHQPNPAAADALVKALRDPSPRVRVACVNALERQGTAESPDVIPALGAVLQKDRELEVRVRTAATLSALARGDDERAKAIAALVLPLLNGASAENVGYLAATCGALGTAGQPAIPELLAQLKKETRNPEDIAGALAELGNVDAFGPYIVTKGFDNYSVKTAIARGLGRQKAFTPAMLNVLKILYQDTDEQVRDCAVQALGTCLPKLPEAIPLLEQAQSDAHSWVRESAAKSIGTYQIDPEQKVRGLLKQMSQAKQRAWGERHTISEAIRALKIDGFRAVAKILFDAESKMDLREAAAEAMGGYWDEQSRDAAAVEQIRKFLRDPAQPLSLRGWCAVMMASGDPRDERVDPTLAEVIAAGSLHLNQRTQAVRCIQYNNPPEKVLIKVAQQCEEPLPADATDDQKQAHSEFHASLLNALNRPETIHETLPRFLAAVEKGSSDVKSAALAKLRYVGKSSPESVQAARSVINHESSSVRSNALETLGACHELAAATIPEIRAALKDENYSVRNSAASALGEFGPVAKAAVPDLLPLVNSDEKSRNAYAAVALAKIAPDDPAVMTELVRALEIQDNRSSALEALTIVGNGAGAAVPTLRKIIPTSDKYVLSNILRLLGKLGADAKPAVPDITALLTSETPSVRESALESLGMLKEHAADAVPEIVQRLSDSEDDVKSAAIQTLSKIGPAAKVAIPKLEKLAATDNESLKYRVEQAIKRLSAAPMGPDAELFNLLSDYNTVDATIDKLPGDPIDLLKSLLRLSAGTDDTVKYRAHNQLMSRLRRPAAHQKLEALLESKDPAQQAFAAVLLNRLPNEFDRVEFCRQLPTWYDYRITGDVAMGLAVQLGPEAIAVLVDTVTGETLPPARRRELLQHAISTTRSRHPAFVSELRKVRQSESPVRQHAAAVAFALVNPKEPGILPPILAGLESEDPYTRLLSITAIIHLAASDIDASAALPMLMKMVAVSPEKKEIAVDGESLTQSAGQALTSIGIGPPQLPQIRQMLQQAARLAEPHAKDEIKAPIASYAVLAIALMSELGPHASELAPDFKTLIVNLKGHQIYPRLSPEMLPLVVDLARDTTLDNEVRAEAVRMLGNTYELRELTAPLLLELLKDPDPAVALQAAMLLSNRPEHTAAALEVVQAALRNRDKETPLNFLYSISGIGKRGLPILPELLKVASDPDVEANLRQTSLRMAMEIDIASPDVQMAVLEIMRTAPVNRYYLQLPRNSEAIIPALIQAVEKGEDPLRVRAIDLLGGFQAKAAAAIPLLKPLLDSEEEAVGTAAALALAQIDPTAKETLPRVMQAFNDNRKRAKAVPALQRLGQNAAELVPVLADQLNDETNHHFPFQVVESLGPAAKPLLPTLVAALLDNRQYYAAQALKKLGENATEVTPALIELMQSGRAGQVTLQIPEVLIKIGGAKQAVEVLQGQLADDKSRYGALQKLKLFREQASPVVPQLLTYATGEPSDLRTDAFDALASIPGNSEESVTILTAALSDPDPHVVTSAIRGLTIRAKDAAPALPLILAALEHSDSNSHWALLHLLEQMKAKEAIPALTKLAETSKPKVKRQIEGTIKRIEKTEPAANEAADPDDE